MEPRSGQASSCTVTVNTFAPTLLRPGVQQKVPRTESGDICVVLKVAPAIEPSQYMRTLLPLGSAPMISKQNCCEAQADIVSLTKAVPVKGSTPDAVGNWLLQLITRNCISRRVEPIRTPLRYSSTKTQITPTCTAVGVKAMAPVAGSKLTPPLVVSGLVALNPPA